MAPVAEADKAKCRARGGSKTHVSKVHRELVIEFLPRFLHPVGPKTQDSSIEVVVAGGVDRRTGNPTTNPVTKGSSRCSRRSPVGRLRGGVDIVGNHLCPEGLVTPLTTMKCFFF